jgi:hypothetical protein
MKSIEADVEKRPESVEHFLRMIKKVPDDLL